MCSTNNTRHPYRWQDARCELKRVFMSLNDHIQEHGQTVDQGIDKKKILLGWVDNINWNLNYTWRLLCWILEKWILEMLTYGMSKELNSRSNAHQAINNFMDKYFGSIYTPSPDYENIYLRITVTLISGRMDTRIWIHPITWSKIHLSLDEWV